MVGEAYDFDHIIALCNGGTHSEDNLAPALREKHREKTKVDVALKSKVARTKAKHLGVYPKGRGFNSRFKRKVSGETVERT